MPVGGDAHLLGTPQRDKGRRERQALVARDRRVVTVRVAELAERFRDGRSGNPYLARYAVDHKPQQPAAPQDDLAAVVDAGVQSRSDDIVRSDGIVRNLEHTEDAACHRVDLLHLAVDAQRDRLVDVSPGDSCADHAGEYGTVQAVLHAATHKHTPVRKSRAMRSPRSMEPDPSVLSQQSSIPATACRGVATRSAGIEVLPL